MRIKKLLSVLLCAALVLILLPVTALAAEHIFYVNDGDVNADITIYDAGSGNIMVTSWVGTTTFPKTEMITIRGTTTKYKVTVASGVTANITLDGVDIDVSTISGACAFDMTGATVNLTLIGNNTLKSGSNKAGLQCPSGATLTIVDGTADGTGSLTATSSYEGAGIGGSVNGDGGAVTISSGTVTATGGNGGAGIGGGGWANGGKVTINGGEVTAQGGLSGAGIGGGYDGEGGEIIITNGTVTTTGGTGGAGIGGGDGNNGGGNIHGGDGGTVFISGGEVTAQGGQYSAGIGGGNDGAGAAVTISGGDVTATGGQYGAGIGGGVGNNVQGNSNCGRGGVFTMTDGKVTATGGQYAAGIGGGNGSASIDGAGDGGTIAISGGEVTATGGQYGGAGLGGGANGNGTGDDGSITISGGDVTASSVSHGAGIGGGYKGNGTGVDGSITISDGKVKATGGQFSAGIGGGAYGNGAGDGGSITISGGEVTAAGNYGGAGLGGGFVGGGSTIEIGGGTVTANGDYGAGVGGGYAGDGGSITISGVTTSVEATSSYEGAGIGGGGFGNGGSITISGGTVTAQGGTSDEDAGGGAGIGGGGTDSVEAGGNGGLVTIGGGSVFAARGSDNAQDIGYGDSGSIDEGTLGISGTAAVFLKNDACPIPTTTTHTHEGPLEYAATLYGVALPDWTGATGIGAYLRLVTLSYSANGGSGTVPDSVTQQINTTVLVADVGSLSRESYTLGTVWNTAANGGGTDYAPGDTFSFTADTMLYAQWTAQPELTSSDEDGIIYVGGRVTLTPNIDGGEWDWDREYLSATFNSPATFTGLKAGTTTITYTVEGQSTTYEVTIQESSLPSTGQSFTWAWVLAALAACAGMIAIAVNHRRRESKC